MSLEQHYQKQVARLGWLPDPAQENAVQKLDLLIEKLQDRPPAAETRNWFSKWFGQPVSDECVQGLYFWGGVGRGKTFLLDAFFTELPIKKKLRIHFHQFMRDVHRQRQVLGDIEEPLLKIAEDYARKYRVICFDEFLVLDIADAMILSKLLGALFVQGVVLVATSNFAPDDLYKDGFQRDRFLPAIQLIKRYCEVVSIDNGIDYRLQQLVGGNAFWDISEAGNSGKFDFFLNQFAPDMNRSITSVQVNGRTLACKGTGSDVIWLDFNAVCNEAFGAADYIELTADYSTIVLTDVYPLTAEHDDIARRLITLIDAMYDHHVRLVMTLAGSLADLYSGSRLAFEFERTRSRLHDMQSEQYLSQVHVT